MFVPLWLIGLTLALLLLLAVLAFRRGSGDMIEQQRRAAPRPAAAAQRSAAVAPSPGQADTASVLDDPEVRHALERGNKIEAIKLVRQRTALGLKEAKDLVESRYR